MKFLVQAAGSAYRSLARTKRERTGPVIGGLGVGDEAPEFDLEDSKGRRHQLSSIEGPVLLIFYPGDDTPG